MVVLGSELLQLKIDRTSDACDGVRILDLVDGGGDDLPEWEPGAHIDIHIPGGLTRQYSLCGDPADRSRYVVAVLLEPQSRGGSAYLHREVRKGDVLTVGLPRYTFQLKSAAAYLFIAGGIGVTPLIPMFERVRGQGLKSRLLYAGRSRGTMAYLHDLDGCEGVEVFPSDEGKRLSVDGCLEACVEDEAHVYACGPTRLLEAIEAKCAELNISHLLHKEYFSGAKVQLDPESEVTFEVVLEKSGMTIQVEPDQTILQAVLDRGVYVDNSCAEGTCGSCEVNVVEGDVDHRDRILDEDERAENSCMMICCSRARSSRLVLDL